MPVPSPSTTRPGTELDAVAEERLAPATRGDEAHVLTVGLGRRAKAALGSELANARLVDVADREQRPRQRRLVEHVHDVALILRSVGAALQREAAIRRAPDAGVVSGGDGVEAELLGPTQQAIELEVPVALDARIGRHAVGVGAHVRGDDVTVEVLAEVEHEMVDVELLRHPAGVVDIADAAAPGVALAAPELHRHADDIVPLLLQQRARDRRVDTAAHRQQNLHRARSGHPTNRRRSCVTLSATTSTARSTSASVVV